MLMPRKRTQHVSGRPLLIFETWRKSDEFRFHEKNLQSILLRDDVKHIPVMIFSIAGAMREGKSFILNFVIRCLKSGMQDGWLYNDSDTLDGFSWRGGMNPDTMGILMWSEPFIVSTPTGKVAIVLMDTQGLFDEDSSMNLLKTIFSISFLLSSFQVYNVMNLIKDDLMQYFQTFLEYANLFKATGDQFLLQRFMFLIRDWPNPRGHPYGFDGGQSYLKDFVEKRQKFAKSDWDLNGVAENVMCFLMPSPGSNVTTTELGKKEFRGELSEIDDKFLKALPELMKTCFASDNIVPKTINGQKLTGEDIFTYAKYLSKEFSGRSIPKADDVMTTVKTTVYAAMKNETLQKFRAKMDKIVVRNRDTANDTQFLRLGRSALEMIFQEYKIKPKFAGDCGVNNDEVFSSLETELNQYVTKQRNYLHELRIQCETLAASEHERLATQLNKVFSVGCLLREELLKKFQEFIDKNPVVCPREIRFHHHADLFKQLVINRLSTTKQKLLESNDRKLRALDISLIKKSQECVAGAQREMEEKIRQRIWNENEIADVKNEIRLSASRKWKLLMHHVNGSEKICNKLKLSMLAEVDNALKGFDERNQERKNEAEQQAFLEVEKVKKIYSKKMKEKIHGIWHEKKNIRSFHDDTLREIHTYLFEIYSNQYLRGLIMQKWDREKVYQLRRFMEENERFLKRDDELCREVVKNCKSDIQCLISKEIGREYHEQCELNNKKELIRKMIREKFHSERPKCADSIVKKYEKLLENYFQIDFEDLVTKTNERNMEFARQDIASLKLEMKNECSRLLSKMLSGDGRSRDRLPWASGVVRNQLHELVDKRANCALVKRRCGDMIDSMVDHAQSNMWDSIKLEEDQRLRDQTDLKMRCLRTYRHAMDKHLKKRCEVHDADDQARKDVSIEIDHAQSSCAETVKEDIFRELDDERRKYMDQERFRKEEAEEHRRSIASYFRKLMEAKLGSYSCSSSRFDQIQKQAVKDSEAFRQLKADLPESTLDILRSEIKKFKDSNDKRNMLFRRECRDKAVKIGEEFKAHVRENLQRYIRNIHLLDDAVERHARQFSKDLIGNSEIITKMESDLRTALMRLKEEITHEISSLHRRQNHHMLPTAVTSFEMVFFELPQGNTDPNMAGLFRILEDFMELMMRF